MSIPGAASPLFLATTAGAAGDFSIARSLRFNSGDSAYLLKDFASAGNRRTWTWSGWVKRSKLGSIQVVLMATSHVGTTTAVYFKADDTLEFYDYQGGGHTFRLITSQVFRDTSSWLHLVVRWDTTSSTSSDRAKIYVNGSQITSFGTGTYPNQNIESRWNNNVTHDIGQENDNNYLDAYLAEVNFIDGQALAPTDFGETDDNGVWQAIDTAGLTFGTNGFRLKFADNSSNAALGTDSSGNSNTWTVNNLSVGAVSNLTAKQNFDVVTYTGNGGTQSISSLAFQPDFVWLKGRSQSNVSHQLYDSVRGVSKILQADNTGNEFTVSGVSAFNSNGFTLGNNGGGNNSGSTYVAWAWKAGGAASSNTDGSITSSVSANASYGFSVCTYTGNNTSGATVGHSLNAVPALIILKDRSSAYNWQVYHKSFAGTSNGIVLNSTSGIDSGSGSIWNSTTPTSTVFSIGNSVGVNTSGNNYVAYVWSEVAGFSKFGSYIGNGSATGPVVTTGFKPRWLMVKGSSHGSNWNIVDTARSSSNPQSNILRANSSAAEFSTPTGQYGLAFDALSDGFQLKSGSSTNDVNQTGETYIYAAFAATVDDSAINDCFVDTPSNAAEPTDTGVGNEVVGNYATMSPVGKTKSAYFTEDGNLTCGNSSAPSGGSGNRGYVPSTIGFKTGKWYCECVTTRASDGDVDFAIGIYSQGASGYYQNDGTTYNCRPDAKLCSPGGLVQSYGTSWADGDVIGIAVDLDSSTKTIQWFKNNVATGSAVTISTDHEFFFGYGSDGGGGGRTYKATWNFGQRAFAYTAPSGYKSLNTANLPTPTIADGSKYFDTKLYSGTGSSQNITGLNFSPDFVWTKARSHSDYHTLIDVVRGSSKTLYSNDTAAEGTDATGITAFNSDGYSLGANTTAGSVNASGRSYVGWAWDAGTSTVTNNDGSIASQVRAQPSAGFSIVSYTGNNTAGASIGHGLNTAPEFIVCKDRDSSSGWWAVYSASQGNTKGAYLNSNQAFGTQSFWNNTTPTSSVFSVGANANTNANGNDFIAYCFAPVAGYSAIGSFSPNGTTDNAFVYTGFRTRFILAKFTTPGDWMLLDTSRRPNGPTGGTLIAQDSAAEDGVYNSSQVGFDFLSNGFKIRHNGAPLGDSGKTVIYYAVAENPFQANGGLAR
jgi:hypothetical protein